MIPLHRTQIRNVRSREKHASWGPSRRRKNVQIVHRIATVLRAFGNQGLLGITDLAHVTGLPKSTTHRLVTALVNEGYSYRTRIVINMLSVCVLQPWAPVF